MFLTLLIAADQPVSEAPWWSSMLMFLPIMVLFYLMLIRPAQRQEKERQALIAAVKRNDKVVTSGGIIGVVANVKDKEDEVTLKIDENSNVRLRVTRSSIVRVISAEDSAKDSKEGA